MEISGKVIHVGDVESFGSNGFTKRVVAIETAGQYPQQIGFELHKDKTALITDSDRGANVTVSIDLRGREYNGKYYTTVVGWKVQKNGTATAATTEDDDDLPY